MKRFLTVLITAIFALTQCVLAYSPLRPAPKPLNIIHIQDIHENEEAQRSIATHLKDYLDRGEVDLIALEGTSQKIDLSLLQSFPDKPTLQKVADYLLSQNKITGPIHALLTSPSPSPPVVGIESQELYDKNVSAYQDSLSVIHEDRTRLKKWRDQLEIRKQQTFNRALRSFDSKLSQYQNGTLSMGDYVRYLSSIWPDTSNEIQILVEAIKLESKLDFEKIQEERDQLLRGEKVGNTNNLRDYVQYVQLFQAVNAKKIIQEIRNLETEIFSSLAQSKSERNLIRESHQLYLTQKLIDFSLTRDEWKEYQRNPSMEMKSYEAFYQSAEKRDRVMAKNLLELTKNNKSKNVVLITGGFHAAGIRSALEGKIGDIKTIVPKITKVPTASGVKSLSVFAQEKTPIEELFQGESLFLGRNPVSNGSVAEGISLAAVEGSRLKTITPRFVKRFLRRGLKMYGGIVRQWGKFHYGIQGRIRNQQHIFNVNYDPTFNFSGLRLKSVIRDRSSWLGGLAPILGIVDKNSVLMFVVFVAAIWGGVIAYKLLSPPKYFHDKDEPEDIKIWQMFWKITVGAMSAFFIEPIITLLAYSVILTLKLPHFRFNTLDDIVGIESTDVENNALGATINVDDLYLKFSKPIIRNRWEIEYSNDNHYFNLSSTLREVMKKAYSVRVRYSAPENSFYVQPLNKEGKVMPYRSFIIHPNGKIELHAVVKLAKDMLKTKSGVIVNESILVALIKAQIQFLSSLTIRHVLSQHLDPYEMKPLRVNDPVQPGIRQVVSAMWDWYITRDQSNSPTGREVLGYFYQKNFKREWVLKTILMNPVDVDRIIEIDPVMAPYLEQIREIATEEIPLEDLLPPEEEKGPPLAIMELFAGGYQQSMRYDLRSWTPEAMLTYLSVREEVLVRPIFQLGLIPLGIWFVTGTWGAGWGPIIIYALIFSTILHPRIFIGKEMVPRHGLLLKERLWLFVLAFSLGLPTLFLPWFMAYPFIGILHAGYDLIARRFGWPLGTETITQWINFGDHGNIKVNVSQEAFGLIRKLSLEKLDVNFNSAINREFDESITSKKFKNEYLFQNNPDLFYRSLEKAYTRALPGDHLKQFLGDEIFAFVVYTFSGLQPDYADEDVQVDVWKYFITVAMVLDHGEVFDRRRQLFFNDFYALIFANMNQHQRRVLWDYLIDLGDQHIELTNKIMGMWNSQDKWIARGQALIHKFRQEKRSILDKPDGSDIVSDKETEEEIMRSGHILADYLAPGIESSEEEAYQYPLSRIIKDVKEKDSEVVIFEYSAPNFKGKKGEFRNQLKLQLELIRRLVSEGFNDIIFTQSSSYLEDLLNKEDQVVDAEGVQYWEPIKTILHEYFYLENKSLRESLGISMQRARTQHSQQILQFWAELRLIKVQNPDVNFEFYNVEEFHNKNDLERIYLDEHVKSKYPGIKRIIFTPQYQFTRAVVDHYSPYRVMQVLQKQELPPYSRSIFKVVLNAVVQVTQKYGWGEEFESVGYPLNRQSLVRKKIKEIRAKFEKSKIEIDSDRKIEDELDLLILTNEDDGLDTQEQKNTTAPTVDAPTPPIFDFTPDSSGSSGTGGLLLMSILIGTIVSLIHPGGVLIAITGVLMSQKTEGSIQGAIAIKNFRIGEYFDTDDDKGSPSSDAPRNDGGSSMNEFHRKFRLVFQSV